MMDYLNREHPVFKRTPSLYAAAFQSALEVCVVRSAAFRLEFDRERLSKVVGLADLAELLPSCFAHGEVVNTAHALDRCEEELTPNRVAKLRSLISFNLEGRRDLPLNYISSLTLIDQHRQVTLHAADMNDTLLICLPEPEKRRLLNEFLAEGVPADVLEPVEIDPERYLR